MIEIIIKNENDFILLDSILKKFEKQSGLSVNVKKTKFMPFAHSSLRHNLYEKQKNAPEKTKPRKTWQALDYWAFTSTTMVTTCGNH